MSSSLMLIDWIVPKSYLAIWGFSLQQKEIAVDEDLPNFFTAVRLNQADEIIRECDNLRDNYGFEIEDP